MRNTIIISVAVVALCLVFVTISYTGAFTPAIDKEKNYYKKQGITISEAKTWKEYKAQFEEGSLIESQVTREQLREEVAETIKELGSCTVFYDRGSIMLWIKGVGPEPDKTYLYWWTP